MTVAARRWRLHLLLAPGFLVLGCTSPNPALYTLSPVPGTVQFGSPPVVVLHHIGLARYLERPEIVRSSADYRLSVMANDQWGEPLSPMIARVLAYNLSQRLPHSSVFSDSGTISPPADASVDINIQRMDADRSGVLVLNAQVQVTSAKPSAKPAIRVVRFTEPIASPDVRSEVAAMSAAIGRLADVVAAMLHNKAIQH